MIIFTMIGLIGALLTGYFFMTKTAYVVSLVIIAHHLQIFSAITNYCWPLMLLMVILIPAGLIFSIIRDAEYIEYRLKMRRKAKKEKKVKEKKEEKSKKNKE